MSMLLWLSCVLFLLLFNSSNGYKFLVYSPFFGQSRVTFLGRTVEILLNAGHQVTILAPVIDHRLTGQYPAGAELIELPQIEAGRQFMEEDEPVLMAGIWHSPSPIAFFKALRHMRSTVFATCAATLDHPGLFDRLRNEHFDVGYGEIIDSCGHAIFHIIGLNKTALVLSAGSLEGGFEVTGAPSIPSYVPGNMATFGDEMTFFQRSSNLLSLVLFKAMVQLFGTSQYVFEQKFGSFPQIQELHAQSSLVFLNADPLTDFPRPTVHKLIDIGGITVASGHRPLNATWDAVLSLRAHTIVLSFGSVAKSYLMPDEFKKTIRETFRKFSEVTFIWKYEREEDNIGEGIENIITSSWVPQNDLLHDRRLSAFITHCGIGSSIEANVAGVPRIVIPVMGDQMRNAQLVKRNQVGIVLFKESLRGGNELEEAIRDILGEKRYKENAKRLSSMIAKRPFAVKDIFIRNMEFIAEFGPLTNLDHYGRQLNFFQYYLIDVVLFLSTVAIIALYVTYKIIRFFVVIVLSKFAHAPRPKIE